MAFMLFDGEEVMDCSEYDITVLHIGTYIWIYYQNSQKIQLTV